jgi:hypothetical protein
MLSLCVRCYAFLFLGATPLRGVAPKNRNGKQAFKPNPTSPERPPNYLLSHLSTRSQGRLAPSRHHHSLMRSDGKKSTIQPTSASKGPEVV